MLPSDKPYLIGETAAHHQGDMNFIKTLINHGVDSGIDALKFHLLLDVGGYFVKSHDAFEIVQNWMFSEQQWQEIVMYCLSKEKDIIFLCNDVRSVDFALSFHQSEIKAIELHATGLNDYLLLEKAAKFDGTVILGVGGSTLDEIEYAVEMLRRLGHNDILFMYGFQNYPTRFEDINLLKAYKLKQLFDIPVGYADHTDPQHEFNEYISVLGIPLGMNICEKHFTHAVSEKRIDSQSAISVSQLKKIRKLMDVSFATIGNGSMQMSEAEKAYGDTGPMKKAIVASQPIQQGEVISMQNIAFKRTMQSTYMLQSFLPKILGLKATKDIREDDLIDFSNVGYEFRKAGIDQFKADK